MSLPTQDQLDDTVKVADIVGDYIVKHGIEEAGTLIGSIVFSFVVNALKKDVGMTVSFLDYIAQQASSALNFDREKNKETKQ